MKVGIIGYGYWGPNLLRNFVLNDDVLVTAVADSRIERLSTLKKTYPAIKTTTNADELIMSPDIDAVAIATPVETHFALAKKALLNKKHVLVEKPLTRSSEEADELIELATRNGCVLMVDHTFIYSGAVNTIKHLVDIEDIGSLNYFDSARINLGLFQSDINVLWDLAPHDISILLYVTGRMPASVHAVGVSHTGNGIEDIAYLTLRYADNFLAHINASWISPVKIRRILLGGSNKMIVYDDVEPTEKVKVYESGYTVSAEEAQRFSFDYRAGDIFIPKLNTQEPLSAMVDDFVNAALHKTQPISNAAFGAKVVRILEAADESLKTGQSVSL